MKILVVGGGSGGHVTPALAVVGEILKLKPRAKVEFWTDRKYFKNVVKITTEMGVNWGKQRERGRAGVGFLRVRKVVAGKFRRYAGWKFWDYVDNLGVVMRDLVVGNVVGAVRFGMGLVMSVWRMGVVPGGRPDVIFLKGGFVGLPVGLAGFLLRIPVVIHESDATMGLANRILSRGARVVAMGMEEICESVVDESEMSEGGGMVDENGIDGGEMSDENGAVGGRGRKGRRRGRREWVGIPVAEEFRAVTKKRQKELKRSFGFDAEAPLVVVTGGSQGSVHLNMAMRDILDEMLEVASVGLVAGRGNFEKMMDLKGKEVWEKAKLVSNFRVWEFCNAMHELLGAADVVISRAGATTIAELATLKRPAVILVPFEKLPGGHQVKNARRLAEMGAAEMIVDEEMVREPKLLLAMVRKLVKDEVRRKELALKLAGTVRPEAARRLAEIVVGVGMGRMGLGSGLGGDGDGVEVSDDDDGDGDGVGAGDGDGAGAEVSDGDGAEVGSSNGRGGER